MKPLDALSLVPTVEDSRRVADALPGSVVLFGSVARGDADHDSDIDLLVIVDHVDRDNPWEHHRLLCDLAEKAESVDARAELVVVDWPEWMSRRQVPGRVEHAADTQGTWLRRHSPGSEVKWEKLMNPRDVATASVIAALRNATVRLEGAGSSMVPHRKEIRLASAGEENLYWSAWQSRLARINGDLHDGLEELFRALRLLTGVSYNKRAKHTLVGPFDEFPGPVQDALSQHLTVTDMQWIQIWHSASFCEEGARLSVSPETTRQLGYVASDVAAYIHNVTGVAAGLAVYCSSTIKISQAVIALIQEEASNGDGSVKATADLETVLKDLWITVDWLREELDTSLWLYPDGTPPNGWTQPTPAELQGRLPPWSGH